jgi:putative FmdB family regulatory protein
MPTYTYSCEQCGSTTEEFHKYSERPDTITCACGGSASHTITGTGLMIKEAFLDGTRRKGWAEFKEASKLNKEANVQRDNAEKKRIAQEIRKMGVEIKGK